ncbi:hypothetical protein L2744_18420 [Shewanella profunda]|uniref:hypothetical protein n=1 Tax=Shewanella profunda TaxID=254793 RepID=UPI00200BC6F2|nr:hypothetical protein [Shewanella profunda]MCL1091537.1 hypothetical protein [Shewanella profunda]
MLFIVNGMVDCFDIRTSDFESIYKAVAYEIYPVSMTAPVKSLLVGKHDDLGGAIMDDSGSPFAIYQALIASGYEVVTFDDEFLEQLQAHNESMDIIDDEPEGIEDGRHPLDFTVY